MKRIDYEVLELVRLAESESSKGTKMVNDLADWGPIIDSRSYTKVDVDNVE